MRNPEREPELTAELTVHNSDEQVNFGQFFSSTGALTIYFGGTDTFTPDFTTLTGTGTTTLDFRLLSDIGDTFETTSAAGLVGSITMTTRPPPLFLNPARSR
jgi:hypothetical protein